MSSRPLVLLMCLLALGACCRRRPAPAPSASASAAVTTSASATAATARCQPVAGGASFRVGDADGATSDGELPFSVELGSAVAHTEGFAVGALQAKAGGTVAVIAVVGPEGGSGRVVELGPTHGNGEPPRLAARAAELFVVLPDSDAAGGTLRLGVLRDAMRDPAITWGAEVGEGWDESTAFDVAVQDNAGVLVWDQWSNADERSDIRLARFEAADVSKVERPRALSERHESVEVPRVVARPGGYWLAYLRREPQPGGARGAKDRFDEGLDSVVELGTRSLRLVPLDGRGVPTAPPRVIGGRASVLVYDLAPAVEGGALLAWRTGATSLGVEGGSTYVAHVGPDGSVQQHELESDGAGVPSLLPELGPRSPASVTWLALGGPNTSSLVALDPEARALDGLLPEPVLGRGDVLARRGEHLLVAEPQGQNADLRVIRCRPGAPAAPVPSDAPPATPEPPPAPLEVPSALGE